MWGGGSLEGVGKADGREGAVMEGYVTMNGREREIIVMCTQPLQNRHLRIPRLDITCERLHGWGGEKVFGYGIMVENSVVSERGCWMNEEIRSEEVLGNKPCQREKEDTSMKKNEWVVLDSVISGVRHLKMHLGSIC